MRVLRPVTAEELPGYLTRASLAFHGQRAPLDAVEARARAIERDRTLGVFEDGELVGTAGIESARLTVPGGRLATAAIGRITVLPTHRRRGIMTEIVHRQLRDVHERGEPVAALFTSEGGIYGRFGFGLATYESHLRIARHRGAFRAPAAGDGLRLVDFRAELPALTAIRDAVLDAVPGAIRRPDDWWRWVAESPAPGPNEVSVVLRAERDGFVVYDRRVALSIPSLEGGSLRIVWLLASTPAAYAALWRHCLDVDLMDEVVAPARSVDEPLRHLLADPRAMETTVWDGLWLRLVDVEAALGGRSYAGPADPVRLAVADRLCPWNAGTYEVSGEGCRRASGARADLALGVEALGACYLGGNRFTTLVAAGRVEERTPGAAARADVLFAPGRAPWAPFHF